MNRPRPFTGTYTALVTPFTKGKVAYAEFGRLVNFQIRSGISGIVPVGTTGESPTVSHEEHLEIIRATVDAAAGRVPVIAGTGSNSTREAMAMTKAADAIGVDGMLLVAPYYNRPTQEGLYQHFARIAGVTDKPIILYSIPGRCGVEISVKVIERLRSRFPHVAHIKEAGGSVDRVDQIISALGDSVTVLSGDDSLTLPFMSVGAQGVISVASNLYPREVSRMVAHALAQNLPRARDLHRRLYPVFKALFVESNPAPVKLAMVRAGLISSADVRAPLCSLSRTSQATLLAALKAFNH